ncbi:hypothetical protein ACP4OV_020260 [Aristida adscensionis]
MEVDRDVHMSRGVGETSYAANSRLQERCILKTRPVLRKAVHAAQALLSPVAGAMVVADLGCSSGPNTLLVVSEVLGNIAGDRREDLGLIAGDPLEQPRPIHVQFFLNDLPGNDFNNIFESLSLFKKLTAEKGEALPPYYIAGLPGSFYTRLFPDHCVHLFHSSYSLMWLSKVPEELSMGRALNEGNMYICETTPPSVARLYQKQFEDDFSLFLKLRHNELVSDGQMVLALLGRKNKNVLHGELSYLLGLLAQAFQFLIQEGRLEKDNLDSFNVPNYAPSVDEMIEVIKRNGLFETSHIELFESNWDPHDDLLDGDLVLDSAQSGVNVARCIRAVYGPLIAQHFGECILNDVFEIFGQNVAKHLQKVKTKHGVILLSLKARRAPCEDNRYSVLTHSPASVLY